MRRKVIAVRVRATTPVIVQVIAVEAALGRIVQRRATKIPEIRARTIAIAAHRSAAADFRREVKAEAEAA